MTAQHVVLVLSGAVLGATLANVLWMISKK